jgi:DNA-binding transcriptional LysR family regulator
VLDREVDFGLVTLPVRHAGVTCIELFTHRDVAIFPASHALASRRRVRLDELARWPLLALEHGSTSRGLLDAAFREAGLEPRIAMALGGVEVIKRLVEIGMGIAVVPETTVVAERLAGRLQVAAVQGLRERPVGLVELCGRVRSRACEAMVELLQAESARRRL